MFMFTKNIRSLIFIIALALVAGCAPRWKHISRDAHRYSSGLGFRVNVPANWAMREDRKLRSLFLTRHSPHMDVVIISRYKLPQSFAHTNHTANAHMLPHEIAELVINNLRMTPSIHNVSVAEVAPVVIDGAQGFRAFGKYFMDNGLPRTFLIYGVIHGGKYYTEIALHALETYYFNETLADFLYMADNLKL